MQVVRIIRKRLRSTTEGVDLDAAINATIAVNVDERSAAERDHEERERPESTQPPREGGTT